MRLLISLIVVIYLVGVGVELAPTFQAKWNSAPASELFSSLFAQLPVALAWPAQVYYSVRGTGPAPQA